MYFHLELTTKQGPRNEKRGRGGRCVTFLRWSQQNSNHLKIALPENLRSHLHVSLVNVLPVTLLALHLQSL